MNNIQNIVESRRYRFLNTYVNAVSMEESVEYVEEVIQSRMPTQHVVINALKINLMEEDHKLQSIVNACPLINADGMSVLWGARILGLPLKERVTGVDLFLRLCERSAEKGYGIYLFGAKEEVVVKAKNELERRYPGLRICGYRNGYFTEADEPEIIRNMAGSGADIMFVGFSSPQKEYWIHEHIQEVNIPFIMGVGGSFDWVAGVTRRAPEWVEKWGFAWLFRLIQEPRRTWRRYLIGNPKFVMLVFKEKLKQIRQGKTHG